MYHLLPHDQLFPDLPAQLDVMDTLAYQGAQDLRDALDHVVFPEYQDPQDL
jgi:hypothetical protein